ncbi:MAG: flavin reductase family protein [Chitinophagaceae bacterium]
MKSNVKRFKKICPPILYIGTPVALITTLDEKGNANIGPVSSAWALGWTVVLGIICNSKTFQNLLAQKQCVINFPSAELYDRVEKIARLTGSDPVPEHKKAQYRFTADKFSAGGFSPVSSTEVLPPRIAECPIQLEVVLKEVLYITEDPVLRIKSAVVYVRVLCVHADERLVVKENHIDPARWDPLIYNFRHYHGLGPELGKTFKAEI